MGGNLSATATTGTITQGRGHRGGQRQLHHRGGSLNQNITLGNLTVGGTIDVHTAGTGNASITNSSAIVFAASSVGGNLSATATTGTITRGGTVAVAGTASFTTAPADQNITLNALTVTGTIALPQRGGHREPPSPTPTPSPPPG